MRHERISIGEVGREPFRVFFPAAVAAGLAGVALWPMFFGGWTGFYPGQAHARLMAYGFFGGFILGFLGTAMPRMLSAPPLGVVNTAMLLSLHGAMVLSFATGRIAWGDGLLAVLLLSFAVMMIGRARGRQDMPPPGFVLVALGFGCVLVATLMAVWQHGHPGAGAGWVMLQRLLGYQGFVLLPILGIGPFILPRFFGMPSGHDFPESRKASAGWINKALLALGVGIAVVLSFVIEAWGRQSLACGIRFVVITAYLWIEFPFRAAPAGRNILTSSLRLALVLMAAGFLAIALFPGHRTGLLHVTFMGGFAIVTFVVATRVVFGHSGNLEALRGRNRWMTVAVSLMILALATRLSGDLWPKVMISHYNYAAAVWAAAVLLWSWKVLPRVRIGDVRESAAPVSGG